MKILVGGWFRLPSLGRDAFSQLMKAGVEYSKEFGFRVGSQTDLESAVGLIVSVTGEEVELAVRCFVCGREACVGCEYLGVCDRRRVASPCLCGEHASAPGAFEAYSKTLREGLDA